MVKKSNLRNKLKAKNRAFVNSLMIASVLITNIVLASIFMLFSSGALAAEATGTKTYLNQLDIGEYINYPVSYTNVADGSSNTTTLTGWRILSKNDDGSVNIVSAGAPLSYYYSLIGSVNGIAATYAAKVLREDFLTISVASSTNLKYNEKGFDSSKTLTEVFTNKYTKMENNMAKPVVRPLDKNDVDTYAGTTVDVNYNISNDLFNIGEAYWIAYASSTSSIWKIIEDGTVQRTSTTVSGVRPVVTLKADVYTTGTDTNGVWNIAIDEETPTNVKVIFDANGGSLTTDGVTETSITVAYNGTYGTLPTPTRAGATFKGWYTSKTDGVQITSSTKVVNPDTHILYARWTEKLADKVTVGDYVNYPVKYDNVVTFASNLTGWRVFSVDRNLEGYRSPGTIILISAGIPLKYYHDSSISINSSVEKIGTNLLTTSVGSISGKFVANGFESSNFKDLFTNEYTEKLGSTLRVEGLSGGLIARTHGKEFLSNLTSVDDPYGIYTLGASYYFASSKDDTDIYAMDAYGSFIYGTGQNGVRVVVTLKDGLQTSGKNGNGAWVLEMVDEDVTIDPDEVCEKCLHSIHESGLCTGQVKTVTECETCGGNGKIDSTVCGTCGGAGTYDKECEYCSSGYVSDYTRRKEPCATCGSDAWIVVCNLCGSGGVRCSTCGIDEETPLYSFDHYKNHPCSNCGATGTLKNVTCTTCGGDGQLAVEDICSTCDGAGIITTYSACTCTYEVVESPITGSVSISGTTKVGQTLTAVTSSITPTGCTLTYQWWTATSSTATSGTNISGATSSTYTLTSNEIGKYIGVTVNASKTNYTSATFKASVVGTVTDTIAGSVKIAGDNKVNSMLTAVMSGLTPSNATLTYQWYYSSSNSTSGGTKISGATNESYIISSTYVGKYIYVEVTASASGYETATFKDITDATANANAKVQEDDTGDKEQGYVILTYTRGYVATGTATKSFTVANHHGGTLSAEELTSYGVSFTITGTTIKVSGLAALEAGTLIRIRVTSSATTTYTEAYEDYYLGVGPNFIIGRVSIDGENTVGQTLTANVSTITPTGCTYTYQWYATDYPFLSLGTAISGATQSTYVPTEDKVGKFIYVIVKATKTNYYDAYFADITNSFENGSWRVSGSTISGSVSISGTTQVGQKLTAVTSSITPTGCTFTYQWWTATSSTATSGTNIYGATSSTYTLTSSQVGKYIGVTVTASKTNYTSATFKAAVVGKVTEQAKEAGYVTLSPSSGTVTAGTASKTFTIASNHGGTLTVTETTSTAAEVSISGTTVTISSLGSLTAGTTVKVRVTCAATDTHTEAYADYTLTVEEAAVTISGSVSIDGTTEVGRVLTANTDSVTPAGCIFTYQWYSNSSKSTWGGSTISGATSKTYTIPSSMVGKYIYVKVTATKGSASQTFTSSVVGKVTEQAKEAGYVTLSENSGTVTEGTATKSFTVASSHGGTLSAQELTSYGVSFTVTGTTIKVSGLASLAASTVITVRVTCAETDTYTAAYADYTLTVEEAAVTISGSVSIDGTTEVGKVLTANTDSVTPTGCTFTYQWYSNSYNTTSFGGSAISGATSKTYTIPSSMVGKYIYVKVTATKGSASQTFTSSVVGKVTEATKETGYVTLSENSGTVTEGTASKTFTIASNHGGTLSVAETTSTAAEVSISGTTVTISSLGSLTVGTTVTVRVTCAATDAYTEAYADYTLTVEEAPVTISGSVSIDGTAQVGKVLTANTDSVTPTGCTFTYQWYSSSYAYTSFGSAISGATSKTYTIPSSMVGKYIYVKVTATKGSASQTFTSSVVGKVTDTITGSVSITGTTNVGQTLTAVTSSITPTGCTFTYQWWTATAATATSGTNISGATSSTYTLTSSELGKYIGVTVNASKTNYTSATFKASVVGKVTDTITGSVSISGTTNVGQTLTAVTSSITPTGCTFTYQWWTATVATATSGTNISGATSSTYTLTSNEIGKYIGVTVNASKTNYTSATFKASVVGAVTDTITGSVSISGTTNVGQTLTAVTSSITPTGCTLTYQWWTATVATATSGTNISGATSSTYTLTSNELGKYIGVTVNASKTNYTSATFKASVVGAVTGTITGSVSITGTTKVGQKLTAVTSSITPTGCTLTYQWWTATVATATSGTNIIGATSSTYTLTSSELGKYIGVTVNASKTNYTSATFKASVVGAVTDTITGSVSISGTTNVGQTLTAVTSSITPTGCTFTYQWWTATAATATSGTNISGATSSTYTLTSNELGKYIGVTVNASKTNYTSATFKASVVGAVTDTITGSVSISGTTNVGQTLTAVTSSITPTGCTFTYQWWTATAATATSGTNISGATSSTYTLTSNELGKYIGVTVNASKTNYTSATFTDITGEVNLASIIDITPPKGEITVANSTIKNNINYVQDSPITLEVYASDNVSKEGQIKVYITTDEIDLTSKVADGLWESYYTGFTKQITLPDITKVNRIYAIFKDDAGNISTAFTGTNNEYTISFNLNGGTGNITSQKAYYGAAAILTNKVPEKAGKYFMGWSVDSAAISVTYKAGEIIPANVFVGATTNITLYAVWGDNPLLADEVEIGEYVDYPVYYNDVTDGTSVRNNAWIVKSKDVDLDGNVSSGTVNIITTGIPLIASSSATQSDLENDLLNMTLSDSSDKYANNGFIAGLNLTEIFTNKYTALKADGITPIVKGEVSGDNVYVIVSLRPTAKTTGKNNQGAWKIEQDIESVTVTFNPNGGTTSLTSKMVKYNETYGTLPTPTRAGYTFQGWYTSIDAGIEITSSKVVETLVNHTLYAKWTANQYTVNFNANSGNVSTSSKTVTYDSTYGTLPTPTRTGYDFLGWYTATSGGEQIIESTIVSLTADQTLYAHWKNLFEITVNFHSEGGTVSPSSKVVNLESNFETLPTPTYSGHTFNGWYNEDGELVDENTVVDKYCSGSGYICNGTKTVSCTTCGGDGKVNYTCPGGSSSWVDCTTCGGDGNVDYTCSGGSSSWVDCSTCSGTGTVTKNCSGGTTTTKNCSNCGGDGLVSSTCTDWSTCGTCGGDGRLDAEYVSNSFPCPVTSCTGTEIQISCRACGEYVKHYCTGTCGSGGGSFAHEQNCPDKVDCSACSGTGISACPHGYTSNHVVSNSATCSTCGGTGKTTTTTKCTHGYTSSHTYEANCSNCSGNGGWYSTTECSHGYTSSHTVTNGATCSNCSGNGGWYSTSTCSHGYTSSHTITNGSTCSNCGGTGKRNTSPCEHGYSTNHEFCEEHGLNYAHIELYAHWGT